MLPIESVLPELAQGLGAHPGLVLQAPPGAGKTTLAPLRLLDAPWLAGRRIVMLEPRRLATRAAAARMAHLLGERPGERIGYRIRRDTVVGPRTRIEVVTEGILTRMLQHDPALEDVGLVIFDEFHERSLHADLGLALALQSRALLRPDLRLLVMSATLDAGPVARLLGDAPVVTSEGRLHPVETRYRPPRAGAQLESAVAATVREALETDKGDILVFLPGQAEIRRTAELLQPDASWSLHLLFGNLSQAEQDRAIAPSPGGHRKVVLATSIAETSLTIEGVRVVVDGGLTRLPRYAPATGMSRLVTARVSRASAEQRRGRAGRTAPGVCYRLWAREEEAGFLPRSAPEILEADLAPLALELARSGIADPAELAWLDPPPAAALAEARSLLRQLGALDDAQRVTPHGRRMVELGTHPRLAHMMVVGAEHGAASLAAGLTALLEERDILRGSQPPPDADLGLRLDLVGGGGTPATVHGHPVDQQGLRRVREEARRWARDLRDILPAGGPPLDAGALLAFAYPDRVALRRPGQAGRFLARNGLGVRTDSPAMVHAEAIVAAVLDGDRRESRVWLGAPLERSALETLFADQLEIEERLEWDEAEGVLRADRRTRLGAITLAERPDPDPPAARVAEAVAAWIRRAGLAVLPWDDGATALRQRIAFLRATLGEPWPDVREAALLEHLDRWLTPRLGVVRRRASLGRIDLTDALGTLLGWEERRRLDELAPTHLTVPTGSRIRVDYADPAAPVLAVRLQELFGLGETPRVGGGRVPVTLHLLSPARRPVQVTKDLAGFWRNSYFDVRKDLRGRYPKHYWPDDPLVAEPTRRAKRPGKG